MPDASTLQLAIAGGTGAFAGATIGNLIQVARDYFNARTARLNREQDMRREAYTSVFPKLLELRRVLLEQQSSTSLAAHSIQYANAPEAQEKIKSRADAAAKCASELISVMQAETLGFASPEVFDAVERLYYNSYLWEGVATQKMRVMIDANLLDRLLAEGVDRQLAIEQYTADSNFRESTEVEHLESLHSGATTSLAQANALLHQMRIETGLTRDLESTYLSGRMNEPVSFEAAIGLAPRPRRRWRRR